MSLNGKAFTGLQMHSLQGGSLLFHYCAGTACCHPAFCEPALLLCVKQGHELVWAPRTRISSLTFPIHCTCLNRIAWGKKIGGRMQLRWGLGLLKPYFFFQVPWIKLFAVCARAAQWQCDHCREKYLWVCTLLPALEEAVWGTPWGWCSKMSTSWQPNKGQSKC